LGKLFTPLYLAPLKLQPYCAVAICVM